MDINNSALSSSDSKTQVMNEVRQQIAIANARQLISVSYLAIKFSFQANVDIDSPQKVNELCFEKCIPTPGTSLSKREEGCFTACMEKYMATWNVVSKQYISRVQRNQQEASLGGGGIPGLG